MSASCLGLEKGLVDVISHLHATKTCEPAYYSGHIITALPDILCSSIQKLGKLTKELMATISADPADLYMQVDLTAADLSAPVPILTLSKSKVGA